MAHTVLLSDEEYKTLAEVAHTRGQTPEEVLQGWLRDLREQGERQREVEAIPDSASMGGVYDPAKDPLAAFLGALEAESPDVVREHDKYLGEAYSDTHDPEQ